MSVASRNAFALLGDEDSAPVAVAPAVKNDAAAPAAPKRSIPGLNRNGASRGIEGARGPRTDAAEGAAEAPQQRDGRSSRGAPRGRGAERGGRGRGAGGRGGRRQFDRHSATGKDDSNKKIGQGWGGDDPKRELDAEDGAKADAAEEEAGDAEKKDSVAPTTNGSAEKELPAVVEEEEKDNTKTLDEYLAEQAAKRAQIGAYKEARAAEVDDKALGTKVTKQLGDDYYSTQKERVQRQRERKEKQVLEIEQSFNPPPSAGRGRGEGRGGRGGRGRGEGRGRGRGEGRGRGGRGGRGGSSAGGANINLADSSAFPTLG